MQEFDDLYSIFKSETPTLNADDIQKKVAKDDEKYILFYNSM